MVVSCGPRSSIKNGGLAIDLTRVGTAGTSWWRLVGRAPSPARRPLPPLAAARKTGYTDSAGFQSYGAVGTGSSGAGRGGSGSGSGLGIAAAAAPSGKAAGIAMRAGADKCTSHSQQSLHRRHFSQRWLSQASLVQRTQIRVESSPQMLQVNGMGAYCFLPGLLTGGWGAIRVPRHRWASRSMTSNWCSRSAARLTM